MPARNASPFDMPYLEMHVTDACNLTCESCSHYSNHGHSGRISLEQARDWCSAWARRLQPRRFELLGGEPTLHPDLPQFVEVIRTVWPRAAILITTNGYFLHRHPRLPDALAQAGNAGLRLSIHGDSPAYREAMAPVERLLTDWKRTHGIRVEVERSFNHWTRRYQGFGGGMMPFEDEDPRASWEICPARYCPQIREGRLWKCAPVAYLPLQAQKYALHPAWDPYLAYRPLEPDATDAALSAFLHAEEEPFCGMCPSARRPFRPAALREPRSPDDGGR